MEFFREIRSGHDAAALQGMLTIATLAHFCAQIDRVLAHEGDQGEIYCLWGGFRVHRECINGGVRFTLPDCPNALAWTITTGLPPCPDLTVVHCTINRHWHEPDFIESIESFIDAWAAGLVG